MNWCSQANFNNYYVPLQTINEFADGSEIIKECRSLFTIFKEKLSQVITPLDFNEILMTYPSKIEKYIRSLSKFNRMKTTSQKVAHLKIISSKITKSTNRLLYSYNLVNLPKIFHENALIAIYHISTTLKFSSFQNQIVWENLSTKIKKLFIELEPHFNPPLNQERNHLRCWQDTNPAIPGPTIFEDDRIFQIGNHAIGNFDTKYDLNNHPDLCLVHYGDLPNHWLEGVQDNIGKFSTRCNEIFDSDTVLRNLSQIYLGPLFGQQYVHHLFMIKKTYVEMLFGSIGIPIPKIVAMGKFGDWAVVPKDQVESICICDVSLDNPNMMEIINQIRNFFLLERQIGIYIMSGGAQIPSPEEADNSVMQNFFSISAIDDPQKLNVHNLPLTNISFIDEPIEERFQAIENLFQAYLPDLAMLIFTEDFREDISRPVVQRSLLLLGINQSNLAECLTESLEVEILCYRILNNIPYLEEPCQQISLENIFHLAMEVATGRPIGNDQLEFRKCIESIVSRLESNKKELTSALQIYIIQQCMQMPVDQKLKKIEDLLNNYSPTSLYFGISKYLDKEFKENIILSQSFMNTSNEVSFDGAASTLSEYFSLLFWQDFHNMLFEIISPEQTILEKIVFLHTAHDLVITSTELKDAVNGRLQDVLHSNMLDGERNKKIKEVYNALLRI